MKKVNLFSSIVQSKLLNIIRHQDQILFDLFVWTFLRQLLSQAVLLSSLHLCIAPVLFLHLSFCQPRKPLHRFLELLAALPKANQRFELCLILVLVLVSVVAAFHKEFQKPIPLGAL